MKGLLLAAGLLVVALGGCVIGTPPPAEVETETVVVTQTVTATPGARGSVTEPPSDGAPMVFALARSADPARLTVTSRTEGANWNRVGMQTDAGTNGGMHYNFNEAANTFDNVISKFRPVPVTGDDVPMQVGDFVEICYEGGIHDATVTLTDLGASEFLGSYTFSYLATCPKP